MDSMNKSNKRPSEAVKSLYKAPLPSARTGPLYNAFSYPTKISPEAIAVFIATHTKPGATVLDAFGGSGTTGLAAMLCDRPTEAMRKMAQDMGVIPFAGAASGGRSGITASSIAAMKALRPLSKRRRSCW